MKEINTSDINKSQQVFNNTDKDSFLYLTAKEICQSILPSEERKKLASSLEEKGIKFNCLKTNKR